MLGDNFLEIFVEQYGWIKTLNATAFFGIALTFNLWVGIHEKKIVIASTGPYPLEKRPY